MPQRLPKTTVSVKHKIIANPTETKKKDKHDKNIVTDVTNNVTTTPLSPSQLISIYGINKIVAPNNQLGLGITVAVIIAYTYANLNVDLKKYCTTYNFPYQPAKIYTMSGATPDSGWAVEECLDVQMIKTFAPYANIVVVEARSSSLTDLFTAIQFANNLSIKTQSNPNPVNIISMSFGGGEFSTESTYASYFNATNVCYVASSGDSAAIVEFPSCLSTVLCVSGTTIESQGSSVITTTWNGAGCGVSKYIAKPTFQSTVNVSNNKRTCGDISLVANPNSGVTICYNGQFYVVGGTSVSAPLTSGFLAICNQLRVANNKSLLSTTGTNNNLLTMLYKSIYTTPNYATCFTDVTTGQDGQFSATVNYDLPTGLGSPICNTLCQALINL